MKTKSNLSTLLVTVILLLAGEISFAQNIGINSTGSSPNASAGLDIDFNNKGLLIPRLTTAEATTLAATAAEGLMIYNTTTKCFQIFIGTAWQNIFCGCTSAPAATGSITGSSPVCANQTGATYSVSAVTGAAGYVWTYTGTGFTIASGNNTNSITANFSAGATSGNLTVYATNACGNGTASPAYPITVTSSPLIYSYTGALQIFTVPACVTSITIEALGGQGTSSTTGGLGGRAIATYTVTPGDILNIYVGGKGIGATGGWNGGASGGSGGGGASDIRVTPYALANRIIVAGGGGGDTGGAGVGTGGTGGGTVGGNGLNCNGANGGAGGTQSAGGAGGTGPTSNGAPGALGVGGTGNGTGGDGGGGYYGGGGGGFWNGSSVGGGTGGGGSGYTGSGTGASMTNGVQSGNGQVTITW